MDVYRPSLSVTTVSFRPVSACVIVTVTPGRTPPLASLTIPVIVPETVCAGADPGSGKILSKKSSAARGRIRMEPPCNGDVTAV